MGCYPIFALADSYNARPHYARTLTFDHYHYYDHDHDHYGSIQANGDFDHFYDIAKDVIEDQLYNDVNKNYYVFDWIQPTYTTSYVPPAIYMIPGLFAIETFLSIGKNFFQQFHHRKMTTLVLSIVSIIAACSFGCMKCCRTSPCCPGLPFEQVENFQIILNDGFC